MTTTPYLRLIATRSRLYEGRRTVLCGYTRQPISSCCWQQTAAYRGLSTAAHCYTPQRRDSLPGWNKSKPSSSSPPPPATRAGVWGARPGRQQQQQHQSRNQIQRVRLPKYKSLVSFPAGVSLQYPHSHAGNQNSKKPFSLQCENFAIAKPGHHDADTGGHVLLARNAMGKSLLVQYLSNPALLLSDQQATAASAENDPRDHYDDGDWKLLHPSRVAHVSFESHLKILTQQPHLRVHDAIAAGSGDGRRHGGGKLSKAAQYLVVRFGIKHLLHRTVSTLSTGEIRKCLLVAALAQEPQLLILENAFDGLDVDSRRELTSIVTKTMQGLNRSGKLLVTEVNAESVAPAQVFLCTHRPEEIVDAIDTVSMILPPNDDSEIKSNSNNNANKLVTIQRPSGWSQEQLMNMALGLDKDHNKSKKTFRVLKPWEIEDETLPTVQELRDFWNNGQTTAATKSSPLMTLDKVEIRRRRDGMTADDETENENRTTTAKHAHEQFVTLLQPLSWEIASGQRWLIAGGNGAGKTTLSRFLLHSQHDHSSNDDDSGKKLQDCIDDTTCDFTSGTYSKNPDATIGWVSTESHLSEMTDATSDNDHAQDPSSSPVTTAWDVITRNGTAPKSANDMSQLVSWIFGSEADEAMLKNCPFQELSQGQQKLVLFASAVAARPKVLIMDEPTQGLDWVQRCRVLAFLERLCQATDTSLVFITHYQEEWIPSISHVLHLNQGRVVYQGPKNGYNPVKLNDELLDDDDEDD